MEKNSYSNLKGAVDAAAAVSVFGWNDMNVEVKRCLNLEEMMEFTDTVVGSCFSSINGAYRPEVKDLVIRTCILEIYANFDPDASTLEKYDLVYQTDIIPEVMKYINQAQFNAIMMAIDSKIDERINLNNAKFEAERLDMVTRITDLLEMIEATFSGVDNETVKNIAGAIAETRIDTDKFIEKVVEENTKARNSEQSAEVPATSVE